ncbi:hypothetical protein ACPZ19_43760 [Amycolatopsis lurida]
MVVRPGKSSGQDRSDIDTIGSGDTPRFEVHTAAAHALVTKPGAPAGLTAEHAADLLYALLSTQLYLLLVRDRAWTPDQWEQWTYNTLRPQLCSTRRPR